MTKGKAAVGPLLTRDAILGQPDLQQETVEVPEWGGSVIVRALNADERDAYESSYVIEKAGKFSIERVGLRAKLVALTVINEQGERLFSSNGDVEALGRKSAAAVDRIYAAAARLSGIRPKDAEELEKN